MASATDMLRKDHQHAMRLERVVAACAEALAAGDGDVRPADVERITRVISEFFDSIHYSREEDSYFPCVGASGGFAEAVHRFLVEHEFGRNVAAQVSRHLARWRDEGDESAREPVARFLRTYSVYLRDHIAKEDKFFDQAEESLDQAEEAEMAEYFASVMATAPRIEAVLAEIARLEGSGWMRRWAAGGGGGGDGGA